MDTPPGLDGSEWVRSGRNIKGRTATTSACPASGTTLVDQPLAPAAVYQHVSAVATNVVVRYPALVRLRRHLPASGGPHISIAVPTMIPVNPHVIAAGRSPAMLDYGDWWTKTNYNVGSRGAESQRTGENNSN